MQAGFEIAAPRWLRRKGLRGRVTVRAGAEGLAFAAPEGGQWEIPAGRILMLRAGIETAYKYGPFHELRLRAEGERGELILSLAMPPPGYAAGLTELAKALEAAGRADRLECGLGAGRGRCLGGMLALPLVFALAVWAVALRDAQVWQGLAVSALPLLLAVLGLWMAQRGRPRKAGSAARVAAALVAGGRV
jgi:hypothetical protein